MRLSGYKSLERQLLLFDEPLAGHGSVRHVVGDLVEGLTAELVGGRRHKNDSRCDYCPDVSVRTPAGLAYLESKAAGRNGETFVYSGRLEKDREFAKDHRLLYCVWHHRARTVEAATVGELQRLVLASLRSVALIPFAALDAYCRTLREEPLNSAYGKGHGGSQARVYGNGYRIRLSALKNFVVFQWVSGLAREGWPISLE